MDLDGEKHIALELDPEWLIIHATNINCEDVIKVAHFIGVIQE